MRTASFCRLLAHSLLLSLLFLPALPTAVHGIDDLFDDPESGIVDEGEAIGDETDPERGVGEDEDSTAEDTPAVLGVDIAALTTAPARFSGSVSTGAGISLGIREWPGTDAADGDEVDDLLTWSAGYDMSTTLSVTARPRPHIRFTGSLTTELNENTGRFTTPAVGNLFVDYTLRNRYFFRVGKYSMTWGQSRLLPNIGNLVSDVSEGASLRLTVPAGPGTMTGVITSRGGDDPRDFIYAGQYETTRGRVSTGIAGRARRADTLDTTAYVTLGLGAVDLTQEGVIRWDRENPFSEETLDFSTLSQVIWELGSPVWRIIGEYGFDYDPEHWEGHRAAIGVRMPQFLPGNWRPQVRWRHAFIDDSGQVETAFTGNLAPDLEGTIGIPVLYGKPGTFYRGEETDLPENGVISVLVGARLKFSY